MSRIFRTEGLTKKFDGFVAVDDVDFEIEEGELRALIGPNGAGKTTFFNMLSGTYAPTSGKIYIRDEDITGLQPYQIVRKGLARSFQISNLFDGLTVMENLRLGVQSVRRRSLSVSFAFSDIDDDEEIRDRAYTIAEQVDLDADADKPVSDLAHGQKRKLEIGIALSLEPELLLLDEPAAGLTTSETDTLMDTIESIADDRTVLLIEHDMEMVTSISDTISVLHNGQLIAEDTPDQIKRNEEVQKVYLGGA